MIDINHDKTIHCKSNSMVLQEYSLKHGALLSKTGYQQGACQPVGKTDFYYFTYYLRCASIKKYNKNYKSTII